MARSDVERDYGGVSAPQRRAERRRRLLAAGREAWGRSGPADVTVRGVSAAAGLQPRYFYEHFAGREELIAAVADEVRAELFTLLVESSLAVDGGLEERLRAALTAFFGAIAADPRVHRIMSTDLAGVRGLEGRRLESLNLVADLILAHGPAEPGDVPAGGEAARPVALFVAGGVNHLLENWLVRPEGSPEELAVLCTRLCLRFVGTDGGTEDRTQDP